MAGTTVQVFDSHDALYDHAAQFVVTLGRRAVQERGRFLLVLSGGNTPLPLYRRLAGAPFRGEAFWRHTHVFWGDERLAPPDDPGSNYLHAHREMLTYLPIPAKHIRRARGELTVSEAAADYSAQLAAYAEPGRLWPRFDLVLLGMGSDGHIASLFPATTESDYAEAVIGVTVSYEDRPAVRITMTPPVFNSARQILLLALGAGKAEAVAGTLDCAPLGAPDPARWPAQRLRPAEGQVSWYLDRPASQALGNFGEKG
jgi:6-phosphogluconolactonase